MTKTVRLQKFMADCGVASRRKAEGLIREGRVKVNELVVGSRELGVKIDPAKDKVTVDGKLIKPVKQKIYIKLNKPRGYVSSCVSERGERTIMDLIPDVKERLYPVGRLDQDSEGLILLTNDGELANRLTHPRYEHEKEYLVNVQLPITNDQLMSLQSGILVEGQKTLPAKVKQTGYREFSIILREGKNRQIRKMVEALGNMVLKLKRIRIGNVTLGELAMGKYAYLSPQEIRNLLGAVI